MKDHRTLICTIVIIFLHSYIFGQVVIDDTLFLQSLIDQGVDANEDGQIQFVEAEAVITLELKSVGVKNLKGIEAFINLRSIKLERTLLEYVDFRNNAQLTSIKAGDNELIEIEVAGLNQLGELVVRNNEIISLDLSDLPKLEKLDAENNRISDIDLSGVPSLIDLNLGDNSFTTIDLSSLLNLFELDLSDTNIETLDLSNNFKIRQLRLSNTNLTTLEVKHLKELIVLLLHRCPIRSLDIAGLSNLFTLWVSESSLRTLYMRRTSPDQSQLKFNGAPLRFICADQSFIPVVNDELGDANNTSCVVSSFCPYTDEGVLGGISGKVKFAKDEEDCDLSTNYVSHPKFYTEWLNVSGQESGVLIGPDNGSFDINFYGTLTITPDNRFAPEWAHTVPEFTASNNASNPQYHVQDFCLVPTIEKKESEIIIVPLQEFRPGFESNVLLLVNNTGTLPLSGTLTLYLQVDSLTYISSNINPSDISDDRVSWEIEELLPFNNFRIETKMYLNSPMDNPPIFGDDDIVLCAEFVANEEHYNIVCENEFSVNSFDPNDKTYLGSDTVLIEQIDELKQLAYLIRFENTGTADAVHVVITDLIDDSFIDPYSIEIIDASHPVSLEMEENNIAQFVFENINLPFESGSNTGYVLFSVDTKLNEIEVKDRIDNSASIYFDFNLPIVTNEASIWIEDLSSSASDLEYSNDFGVNVFPNPAHGVFNIESSEKQDHIESIEWIDMFGRTEKIEGVNSPNIQLNANQYIPGLYLFRVKTVQSTKVVKMVISGK